MDWNLTGSILERTVMTLSLNVMQSQLGIDIEHFLLIII